MSEAASERKLTRKERELQFRMGIVLDAAQQVFAESSYAASSVEEIARRAEISVGTLYNLFNSKEEIYTRVVSRAQAEFFEYMTQEVREARGPAEKLRQAIHCHFEHFKRYLGQWRLYVSASNGFQWELKSKLADEANVAQSKFLGLLTDIIQTGMDEGVFKPGVAADDLALSILAVPHAFLVALLFNEDADPLSGRPHAIKIVERMVGLDVE